MENDDNDCNTEDGCEAIRLLQNYMHGESDSQDDTSKGSESAMDPAMEDKECHHNENAEALSKITSVLPFAVNNERSNEEQTPEQFNDNDKDSDSNYEEDDSMTEDSHSSLKRASTFDSDVPTKRPLSQCSSAKVIEQQSYDTNESMPKEITDNVTNKVPGVRSNLMIPDEVRKRREEEYKRQIALSRGGMVGSKASSFSTTNKGTSTKSQLYANSAGGPPPPPKALIKKQNVAESAQQFSSADSNMESLVYERTYHKNENTTENKDFSRKNDETIHERDEEYEQMIKQSRDYNSSICFPKFNKDNSVTDNLKLNPNRPPFSSDSLSNLTKPDEYVSGRDSSDFRSRHSQFSASQLERDQTDNQFQEYDANIKGDSRIVSTPQGPGFKSSNHLAEEAKRKREEEYEKMIAQSRGGTEKTEKSFSTTNKGTSTKSKLYTNTSGGPPPPPKALIRGNPAFSSLQSNRALSNTSVSASTQQKSFQSSDMHNKPVPLMEADFSSSRPFQPSGYSSFPSTSNRSPSSNRYSTSTNLQNNCHGNIDYSQTQSSNSTSNTPSKNTTYKKPGIVSGKKSGFRTNLHNNLSAEEKRKAEEEYRKQIERSRGKPLTSDSFSLTNKGTSTKSKLYPNSCSGPPPPPKALVTGNINQRAQGSVPSQSRDFGNSQSHPGHYDNTNPDYGTYNEATHQSFQDRKQTSVGNMPPSLIGRTQVGVFNSNTSRNSRFDNTATRNLDSMITRGNNRNNKQFNENVSNTQVPSLMEKSIGAPQTYQQESTFTNRSEGRYNQPFPRGQGRGSVSQAHATPSSNFSKQSPQEKNKSNKLNFNVSSSISAEQRRKAEEEYRKQVALSRGAGSGGGQSFSTTHKGTSTKSKLYSTPGGGPPPPPKSIVHSRR